MKIIFFSFVLFACTMAGNAQIKPTIPISTTNKINSIPKITDLTVTIDRIDDINSAAASISPRYDVHYTVTNIGSEDIIGLYILLRADFYKSDGTMIVGNSNFGLAGPIEEQNEVRVMKPGAVVRRVVSVYPQQPLYFDLSYKLVIKADHLNKIAEANEYNNTAERSITPHSDYPETEYFLTGVTFNIRTGNDNKESKDSDVNFNFRTGKGALAYRYFGYTNEIKINSNVSITPNQCMIPNPPGPFSYENSLQYYKQNGIRLDIIYDNRLIKTNAWKIEGVSVTLQFTSRNGKLSPTYGKKTIDFSGAKGILGYRLGDNIFSNENQMRVLSLTTKNGNLVDKLSGSGTTFSFLTEAGLAHL